MEIRADGSAAKSCGGSGVAGRVRHSGPRGENLLHLSRAAAIDGGSERQRLWRASRARDAERSTSTI